MPSQSHFAGFNKNPNLEGLHAFLSPSSPSWLRYTEEQMIERLSTAEAAAKGTRLHDIAARCIDEGIELAPNGKYPIIAAYVNDAITLGMIPELTLFYKMECFGHTDAIGFDPEELFLRVHDLKTGVKEVKNFDQLYVYAALFCLEYEYSPFEISGELRIYQGEDVNAMEIDRTYLARVYEVIRWGCALLEERKRGELI